MWSKDYQLTSDIDWFCIINHKYVHIASNGNRIPDYYTKGNTLTRIQNDVHNNMPNIFDYELNRLYLREIRENDRMIHIKSLNKSLVQLIIPSEIDFGNRHIDAFEMAYCWSFIEMAQKGFYSYDTNEYGYRLIASPIFGHNTMKFESNQKLLQCDLVLQDMFSLPQNLIDNLHL